MYQNNKTQNFDVFGPIRGENDFHTSYYTLLVFKKIVVLRSNCAFHVQIVYLYMDALYLHTYL